MDHAGTFPISLLRLSSTEQKLCTNTSVWLEAEAHLPQRALLISRLTI